jgi:hypothetical protein
MFPIKAPLRLRMRMAHSSLLHNRTGISHVQVGVSVVRAALRNIFLAQMDISRPGEDLESISLRTLFAYVRMLAECTQKVSAG